MKKTLMAAAAMAFSAGVLAQSSVTLYGVADVAVGKIGDGKVQMHSSQMLNNSESYLGFRGVEDLGAGMKAGFAFEQALDLEDGSAAFSGLMWQREANVWLGGGWGRLQLGRAKTPSFRTLEAWNLMGAPNYGVPAFSFGAVGGNAGTRQSSMISYQTPVWGGFSAEVGYVFKADNNDAQKVDVGLIYANGPLSAGLAANKTKGAKLNYALGAKYGFGAFTVAASYQDSRNWTSPNLPGVVAQSRGVTLGAAYKFGAFNLALDVSRQLKHQVTQGAISGSGKKYTNGVLEMKYALSKRTFFYGVYARANETNNYGLGMQHKF